MKYEHRLDIKIFADESFMVGDRWRDVESGKRAGCRTVFIDYQYREKRPSGQDYAAPDLSAAAAWILRTAGRGSQ